MVKWRLRTTDPETGETSEEVYTDKSDCQYWYFMLPGHMGLITEMDEVPDDYVVKEPEGVHSHE